MERHPKIGLKSIREKQRNALTGIERYITIFEMARYITTLKMQRYITTIDME